MSDEIRKAEARLVKAALRFDAVEREMSSLMKGPWGPGARDYYADVAAVAKRGLYEAKKEADKEYDAALAALRVLL